MYKNPHHRMTLHSVQCELLASSVSLIGKTEQLINNETTPNDIYKCSKSFHWKSLQPDKFESNAYGMRILALLYH